MNELGELAAKIMETVSDEFPASTIRTVALVLDLDSEDHSTILVASSDDRPWVQIALLNEGIMSTEDRLKALRQEHDEND